MPGSDRLTRLGSAARRRATLAARQVARAIVDRRFGAPPDLDEVLAGGGERYPAKLLGYGVLLMLAEHRGAAARVLLRLSHGLGDAADAFPEQTAQLLRTLQHAVRVDVRGVTLGLAMRGMLTAEDVRDAEFVDEWSTSDPEDLTTLLWLASAAIRSGELDCAEHIADLFRGGLAEPESESIALLHIQAPELHALSFVRADPGNSRLPRFPRLADFVAELYLALAELRASTEPRRAGALALVAVRTAKTRLKQPRLGSAHGIIQDLLSPEAVMARACSIYLRHMVAHGTRIPEFDDVAFEAASGLDIDWMETPLAANLLAEWLDAPIASLIGWVHAAPHNDPFSWVRAMARSSPADGAEILECLLCGESVDFLHPEPERESRVHARIDAHRAVVRRFLKSPAGQVEPGLGGSVRELAWLWVAEMDLLCDDPASAKEILDSLDPVAGSLLDMPLAFLNWEAALVGRGVPDPDETPLEFVALSLPILAWAESDGMVAAFARAARAIAVPAQLLLGNGEQALRLAASGHGDLQLDIDGTLEKLFPLLDPARGLATRAGELVASLCERGAVEPPAGLPRLPPVVAGTPLSDVYELRLRLDVAQTREMLDLPQSDLEAVPPLVLGAAMMCGEASASRSPIAAYAREFIELAARAARADGDLEQECRLHLWLPPTRYLALRFERVGNLISSALGDRLEAYEAMAAHVGAESDLAFLVIYLDREALRLHVCLKNEAGEVGWRSASAELALPPPDSEEHWPKADALAASAAIVADWTPHESAGSPTTGSLADVLSQASRVVLILDPRCREFPIAACVRPGGGFAARWLVDTAELRDAVARWRSVTPEHLLVLGCDEYPERPLRRVAEECVRVGEAPARTHTLLHNPAPAEALSAIGEADWIHLALHGQVLKDASNLRDAAVQLPTGELTLSAVAAVGGLRDGCTVVVNACWSGRTEATGWGDEAISFAHGLLALGARQVVAPTGPVDDAHAAAFARGLYDNLAKGASLAHAVEAASRGTRGAGGEGAMRFTPLDNEVDGEGRVSWRLYCR